MYDKISYLESMVVHSKAMFARCVEDSDDAVKAISSVVELLLDDSNRIAEMSADTENEINAIRGIISEINQETTAETLHKLIKTLSDLMNDHKSVPQIITPIIEALQFQDAMRQQLENLGRALDLWLTRLKNGDSQELTIDELTAFGKELIAITTMQSERNIIRQHISGLGEEEKAKDVMMF